MVMPGNRLLALLDEMDVAYERIHHRPEFSAQRTAADTHTPGKAFAKPVVLDLGDGKFAMVVLPAHCKVDLDKARQQLGADEVRLASEQQLADLFPDCELGAEPPFGNLYNLPVYVSKPLPDDESITFDAGSHEEALHMRYSDYERLVKPEIVDIVHTL